MFSVLILFFVLRRFVFVSPLMQNEFETETAHEIANTPFRSSPAAVSALTRETENQNVAMRGLGHDRSVLQCEATGQGKMSPEG